LTIEGKRILILGSTGLCGRAICRELLPHRPAEIILAGLFEPEVIEIADLFRKEFEAVGTTMRTEFGNVFMRTDYKDLLRGDLMDDPAVRRVVLSDIIDELNEEILVGSFLYEICRRHQPHVIIDCINTATAVAYQDIFLTSKEVRRKIEESAREGWDETVPATLEKHLCSLYLPQLIRHIQILYEAMKRVSTGMYVKVGTTGTGGMGLNIPYTHSEERPSRVLLSKTSVAGAHSMLLYLMGRTPDAPITKEIKPAAIIAWKSIAYGPIRFRGRSLFLLDVGMDDAVNLEPGAEMPVEVDFPAIVDDGGNEENGLFSRAEFETITSIGQMEFVTPEEIAREVLFEIVGRNSGHDVIAALDQTCLGPSYRAGLLRHAALEKMAMLETEHGVDSVAFEMLGPPRLSKLLYEAYLLKTTGKDLGSVRDATPDDLSDALETRITSDAILRSTILSIGIPILLPDGRRLLRGAIVKVPPSQHRSTWTFTPEKLEEWCRDGWVDLRVENMERWIDRIRAYIDEREAIPRQDTSSRYERDSAFWGGRGEIDLGRMVSWILRVEDGGFRLK
jgi:NAD(P)-dependent dehydrogenase (short-subunit alcohol dehydrogenase family)